MSTLSVIPSSQPSSAQAWFQQHLPEITSRAAVFARRLRRGQRDEAVAEILAQVWKYAVSAAARGVLARLTPFTLVSFFGRGYAAGRRLTGSRTTDVLSPAAQRRHRLRVVSLDQPRRMHTPEGEVRMPLSEVLADKRSEPPLEACRKDLDYPAILRRQKASRKARCVFAWLAQTRGTSRQTELARALGVSPPRIVQLKHQLARCLAAEGYTPPDTRPDRQPRSRRGRPRRPAPRPTV